MLQQLHDIVIKVHDGGGLGFKPSTNDIGSGNGLAYGLIGLGAGAAMAAGIGTGAGQGIAAGRAAEAVGRNPEAEARIRTMMIIGAAIAESSAIYGLIVAILLLFVF